MWHPWNCFILHIVVSAFHFRPGGTKSYFQIFNPKESWSSSSCWYPIWHPLTKETFLPTFSSQVHLYVFSMGGRASNLTWLKSLTWRILSEIYSWQISEAKTKLSKAENWAFIDWVWYIWYLILKASFRRWYRIGLSHGVKLTPDKTPW